MADAEKNNKENSKIKAAKSIDLDDVLVNELGQFGRFQLYNILLVAILAIMSTWVHEYIFSTAAIPHRCQIPECGETSKDEPFDRDWLSNAIPQTDSGFDNCVRFAPINGSGSAETCPSSLFDITQTIRCENFVYARDNSIVYDFDLGCQNWLRVLPGTLSSIGALLVHPIAGFVSDNYGRRIALVLSVFNFGLFGVIKAFSVNYTMFATMELLTTTFSAGLYSSVYIFATELVGPKYRVFVSATCCSMVAVGQVTVGAVAWLVQPWRQMILTLHVPCFLCVVYYWILTESVRWLLSRGKYEEAKKILEKVAKVNRKGISEKSLNDLLSPSTPSVESKKGRGLISSIIKSRVLLRRVCTTPIWWVSTTFVYYGLSINSTSLSDTMYLNYILTCAIEMPGFYSSALVLNRIGRKATLSGGFFLSAVCNFVFAFTPSDLYVLRLVIFLLGKFGISVVANSLYLYTSELYPTEHRHTLFAFSSMIGRIGSITAPLTPALRMYWSGVPSTMFGVMALVSGVLVLTQPETLGTRVPDTLAEAEALGTPSSFAKTVD